MDELFETSEINNNWIQIDVSTVIEKITINKNKIKQKEYLSSGKLPIIDQGIEFIGGYTKDEGKTVECELPVIVFGDHTKVVKYINFNFAPGADGIKVIKSIKGYNPKLLKFFIQVLTKKIPDKGYARHFQHIKNPKFHFPPSLNNTASLLKLRSSFQNSITVLKA